MEVSTLPRSGGRFLPHPRQVLKAFSDERLVDQIRRGNDAAFEVAYERHHRPILSFCRHMLSSQEEAEDAVQQTFVAAYYDLRSSDKDIKLKPWLYTIARNRSLSMLRARREQPSELDEIPTTGLSEAVHQRDDLRRMLADMRDLPAEQRAALVLSELGDLSHAEIAGVLGCATPKVKSLVFQARSALIESREARETPCREIREQLATLRGGALRRGPLRKHLSACAGCREFRDEVKRQRAAVALLLPVVPTAGLKSAVMAAIGGGGGAAGGAAGLAAGGGIATVATGGATKLITVVAITAGTVGGGIAVRDMLVDGAEKAPATTAVEPGGAAPPGAAATSAGATPMVERNPDGSPKAELTARGGGPPALAGQPGAKGKKKKGKKDRGRDDELSGIYLDPGFPSGTTPAVPAIPGGPGTQATPATPAVPGRGGGRPADTPRGLGAERGRAGNHGGRHGDADAPGGKHDGRGGPKPGRGTNRSPR